MTSTSGRSLLTIGSVDNGDLHNAGPRTHRRHPGKHHFLMRDAIDLNQIHPVLEAKLHRVVKRLDRAKAAHDRGIR